MTAQAANPVEHIVAQVHAATERFRAQAVTCRSLASELEAAAAKELVRRNDDTVAGVERRRLRSVNYPGVDRRST